MTVTPAAIRAAFAKAYAPGTTPKDAALAFAECIPVFPQIKAGDGSKYPADAWKYGFGQDFVLDGNGEKVIDPRTLRPKRVPLSGGQHKATTDPKRIAGAWIQFPQAIVGTIVPDGYVFLDLDRHKKDADGVATFERLLAKHGQSLRTLTTGTPRGGRHICFRLGPSQELPRADKLEGLSGIEIFPAGYWLSEGVGYSMLDDAEPAEMPGWLYTELRLALPKMPEPSTSASPVIETGQLFGIGQRLVKVPAEAYKQELAETLKTLQKAEPGTRDNALLAASRRIGWCIAEGGISEEHARDKLIDVALEIGLGPGETQSTIVSGFAWARKNPRVSDRLPSRLSAPMQLVDPLDRLDDCAPRQGVYEGPPPPYSWLFTRLLEQGELAVLAGPGGSGKSTAALQGVFAVGTGGPWLYGYSVGGEPGEAWYLSSEDSRRTLHRKGDAIMETLTPAERGLARRFVRLMHLPSRYCLLRQDSKTREVVPTEYWQGFREKVMARRPRLIVLDPLSSVMLLTETDNTATTDALGYLEELCEESGTCILFLHHVQKTGSLLKDPEDLVERLDQTAIRGAGAIVNTPRTAMLMYPLSVQLAKKCLEEDGEAVKRNGQIVACAEVKKNSGILAPLRFLKHTSNMGLLEPCLNVRSKFDFSDKDAGRDIEKLQKQEGNARLLAEEAVRREQSESRKRRIAPSKAAVEIGLTGGNEKSNLIATKAVVMGLVHIVNVRDLSDHGFAPGRSGSGRIIVPSIEALRKYGQPDIDRPGEWLNVSAELRQWIESGCTDEEPEAEAVQQEPEGTDGEAENLLD